MKTIPPELSNDFSLNGQIPIEYNLYYEPPKTGTYETLVWHSQQIDFYLDCARRKSLTAYEDDRFLYPGLDRYRESIVGKEVAVIGSVRPCYEAILLSYGARPITIEYATIICSDPRLQILTVDEFKKNPRTFDAILSVSSIEHDGLGRYGDPIDPYADLKFLETAKQLIPKNGLFFLQVPLGRDRVCFNEHRIYGPIRLPMLLKGWKVLDVYGFSPEVFNTDGGIQPLFVLTPQ